MSHKKIDPRKRRQLRIRKKVMGTTERPRLAVFRSNRFLYAQIIDDVSHKTIVEASSMKEAKGSNKNAAELVGKSIADKAIANKIDKVVFDRSGYQYHGVIKSLADAARGAGLKF